MEWTELQAMWQQYDARLAENTRINKEILKRMLSTKPDGRVNRVKMQMIGSVFLAFIISILFFRFSPEKFEFNQGFILYLGIFLCGSIFLLNYYWWIKYFILLRKIDFTHSVVTTRKELAQLERYQTIRLKLGYALMPIGMAGIFLIFDVPVFTNESAVPLLLMFVIMVCSMYFHFRWKNRWFKKLNTELDEIEQLEKE